MQIEGFLIEGVGHSAIFDGQLKVEEDGGIRLLGDFPTELSELVEVFLKALPHSAVEVFVGAVPDSEDVIDVAFVKQKKSAILAKDSFLFVDTKVEGGVHWSWRSTHGGAGELKPAGVSKLKEVVFHDDVEGCHNCLIVWRQREVSSDDGQGMVGVDVGVHRDGIGCEEPIAPSGRSGRSCKRSVNSKELLRYVGSFLQIGCSCWSSQVPSPAVMLPRMATIGRVAIGVL